MLIDEASEADLPAIAKMMVSLWPECDEQEELANNIKLLQSNKDILLVARFREELTGFIHLSLRYEFVEGTESSPVGYVEAIYVEEVHRKSGIGSLLLTAGEDWCKQKGCTEMASDTEIENTISAQFHESQGFEVKNRIICFAKKL